MEFLEFLAEYKKHFPEATSEQVNEAFLISTLSLSDLNETVKKVLEESVGEIVENSVEKVLEESVGEIVENSVEKILEESVGEIVENSVEKAFKQLNQEEISVSNLSNVRIQKIINDVGIKFLKLSIDDFIPIDPIHCDSFEWDLNTDENKQMDDVTEWFTKILKLPKGFKIEDIHAKTKYQRRLRMANVTLTGGSDISMGPSGTGCVWVEVKKAEKDCKESQAIGELLLADAMHILHTMVVLTDCNDYWNIFYFMEKDNEQCIANCNIGDRSIAFAVIQQFILKEGIAHASWTGKFIDYSVKSILPLERRAKFLEYVTKTDDHEDRMMDIINDMSDKEKFNMNARKKLMTLRECCKLDEQPYVDQMIRNFSDDYQAPP
ncbi:18938_t:CDS:2, partial [Funneliformis geosporum]